MQAFRDSLRYVRNYYIFILNGMFFLYSDSYIRFVDGRLLDWRELGIGPWLLPIWDRRRQREVTINYPSSKIISWWAPFRLLRPQNQTFKFQSSGSKLIQREENAEVLYCFKSDITSLTYIFIIAIL